MSSPAPSARRLFPIGVLVAVAVVDAVLGGTSRVGAEVDSLSRSVWAASCVAPGSSELVVYGSGWTGDSVNLALDQAAAPVGSGSSAVTNGHFQAHLAVVVPALTSPLHLVVTPVTGNGTEQREVNVAASCSPSVVATITGPSCAMAGRPITIALTVRGIPAAVFDRTYHYVDLYGPAEVVDRSQPSRDSGDYGMNLTVSNIPARIIPVTVEAHSPVSNTFTYATTTVGLPPVCPATTTSTTSTTAATTTAPTTTVAPTTPTTPAPVATPPRLVLLPKPISPPIPPSLLLSPALGQPGQVTTVTGVGFSPSATVTLRWRPGIGTWTVRAGGDGSFRTQVLVLPKDIEGSRSLEVVEGGAASARYLVVPGSDQPAFGGVFVRS